jgi:hypothetical protein
MLEQPFVWCLVANVTREPQADGPEGELRIGLKHFSPGAKLYCFPQTWGDGGARIRVLGRHRSGAKLIDMVVANRFLTNWRVQKAYNLHVVNAMRGHWDDSDKGRAKAQAMLDFYRKSCGFVCPEEPSR